MAARIVGHSRSRAKSRGVYSQLNLLRLGNTELDLAFSTLEVRKSWIVPRGSAASLGSRVDKSKSDLQNGYDRVAEHYATEFFEELKRKPFDCQLLDGFAKNVAGAGKVCELGCGPGQVARYLKDRGVNMRGVDLSPEMVRVATRLNPDIPFEQGDMLSLSLDDDSLAAVVLFYSIIHIKREDVTRALQEIKRVLTPGGKLFLTFHGGEGQLHRDEWYGERVSIDFRLFQGSEMSGYLEAAGFEDIEVTERPPYPFEHPTNRFYVFARKASKPASSE